VVLYCREEGSRTVASNLVDPGGPDVDVVKDENRPLLAALPEGLPGRERAVVLVLGRRDRVERIPEVATGEAKKPPPGTHSRLQAEKVRTQFRRLRALPRPMAGSVDRGAATRRGTTAVRRTHFRDFPRKHATPARPRRARKRQSGRRRPPRQNGFRDALEVVPP
jgi:hypothetical protein